MFCTSEKLCSFEMSRFDTPEAQWLNIRSLTSGCNWSSLTGRPEDLHSLLKKSDSALWRLGFLVLLLRTLTLEVFDALWESEDVCNRYLCNTYLLPKIQWFQTCIRSLPHIWTLNISQFLMNRLQKLLKINILTITFLRLDWESSLFPSHFSLVSPFSTLWYLKKTRWISWLSLINGLLSSIISCILSPWHICWLIS